MKTMFAAALAICFASAAACTAQQAGLIKPVQAAANESASALDPTPAEQRIAAAKRQIAADAKKVQAFNDLAAAYIRRARETADTKFLGDAEGAIAEGLRLDPADFQLKKTQVTLMLARGQYARAKEKAAELNRQSLDDVMVYGYLAEAEIGLGEYDAAVTNAQWMLNMLPNNVPGLMIGARLREHFGDANGAIDFLNLAYTETSPTETEEQAWIANQIASIEIENRKADAAIEILNHAEQTFPNYPTTRSNLAKAHSALHGSADARPAQPSALADPQKETAHDGSASISEPAQPQAAQARANAAFLPVSSDLLTPRHSDTERVIRKSQAIAAASPRDAKAFAALGAAYAQRARETGDVSDYELAEQALNKSLDLSSSDFSSDAALESLAEVCMGEHRFADALNYAQKALSLGSGNLAPFGIAGDAYADMGEYDKAREAYGKLAPAGMTISPRAAYARDSRLAYLDFVQGDTRGAILLMTAAVAEGSEASIPTENQAWLYYELGEFQAQAGDAADANAAYLTALKVHPGDYRALAGLARLRANHGRYDEAITLYRKAIAVVPMPMFVAELGDLYQKAGRLDEAKKEYDLVEYIGRLGKVNQVLHNRDLALFYADHDIKLSEALELAHKEFEVRRDIYTWDALAWALYKNGKFVEAESASDEALKYGTRDALLLFHAGTIADKLGQQNRARIQLKMALEINPDFSLRYSPMATDELAKLDADVRPRDSEANNAR
jgi:tetratricopeptide (TPR) repeat protein